MERLKKTITDFFIKDNLKIDNENEEEFKREVAKDNFLRLTIMSGFMFAFESYLYAIEDSIFYVGPVILKFLILCAALLPFVWYVQIKIKTVNLIFALIMQYAFVATCVIFGASVALYVREADIVHVYLVMVFFSAAFFSMPPLGSFLLYSLTYLYFFLMLPYYVSDLTIIHVLRINTAGAIAAAWIMSNVLWRAKISVFSNKKLLYKQNNILQEMNKKDAMTALYNHETSLKLLKREIKRAIQLNSPISLIIADIDDFKNVNDSYGHLAGDYVIKDIAKIISNTARKTDLVGRYGGEEFIIIMPDTDLEAAHALSERICTQIKNANLYNDISITLSGGISQFNGEAINDFIRITDNKLYTAKNNGKKHFETENETIQTLRQITEPKLST